MTTLPKADERLYLSSLVVVTLLRKCQMLQIEDELVLLTFFRSPR